ncbi:MAG: AAA family ATPase, partial [bacterium]
MYETFFTLKRKPFELVPNPEFIYLSRTHRRAVTFLEYGIRERVGFVLLTGDVGSGKTTIVRDMIKKATANVTIANITNTKANSEQLLSMITSEFDLNVQIKDKVTLIKELNDYLIDRYARGKHSILLIDEAQNLNQDMLEEVRLLSNLETDDTKLLQIILVGQPEIRTMLSRPDMRQLRQRIGVGCHITPLSISEVAEYIRHRLEVAGNREAILF